MSTLKVNTLEEATVGGATFFTAKAWVYFNGQGTVAIRDSGNVSSITDNAIGITTVTFSNSFDNTNYSMSTSIRKDNDVADGVETLRTFLSSPKATGSLSVISSYVNPSSGVSGYFDSPENGAHFIGDLA